MEEYYYQQMNKHHQAIYHSLREGLLALAPVISVPKAEQAELSTIFFQLRLDHPEIFYGVTFRYQFYPEASSVELLPTYLFEKQKIREHQKALNSRVEKLARQCTGRTDWEKLLYIHDFICTSVHYDKLKKPYSHEIIGPLGHGVGVCEGIAKSVKMLCDALGIWCILVISSNNPEKGIKYRHAWNVVKLGSSYYHLDATFDLSLSKAQPRYDYFCLNDRQIARDHEPLLFSAPACTDGDHFYYKEKKLSFTKEEEVLKRSLQALKKKKPFLFHWRGGYLTRELLTALLEPISAAAKKKGQFVQISLNWPQAVVSLSFQEQKPESLLVLEEANEGELHQETDLSAINK